MTNTLHKVEALLFSSGKRMAEDEIAKLSRKPKEEVVEALKELRQQYEDRGSSLMVIQENDKWKIAVREAHLNLVKKIVSQTELPKTMIETLATIAWKAPCLQSEIIRIRTNKAYDHLKQLEEDGFITRKKEGRTQRVALAQKFYEYFDIPHRKVEELFGKFKNLEKQIEEKEHEAHEIREKVKKVEAEHRSQKEQMEKGDVSDVFDEETAVEQVAEQLAKEDPDKPSAEIEPYKDHLGNLEVVKVPPKPVEHHEEKELTDDEAEERVNRDIPDPVRSKVDKRVQEIMGGAVVEASDETEQPETTEEEPQEPLEKEHSQEKDKPSEEKQGTENSEKSKDPAEQEAERLIDEKVKEIWGDKK